MTDLIKRLWQKDASLWSSNKKEQAAIVNRLGWLDSPQFFNQHIKELTDFAVQVKRKKFTQVVLLGMGGSSLCPYMFSTIFGSSAGFPQLLVLDSTDPDYIRQVQARINIAQSLFIVASKSGGTIEPNSLFKYFYTKVSETKNNPGENFIAITDKGSSLTKLAEAHGFRKTFINPCDIGGRYSALSFFGLVPAAVTGIGLESLRDSLLAMDQACTTTSDKDNPALELAAYMAEMVNSGKDKLTFLMDASLLPFGLWLEQLVAESTGKKGGGVIPVVGEIMDAAREYGADRCFVSIGLEGHESKERLHLTQHLRAQKRPVKEYTLKDPYELAGEFLRWEAATALCGHLLKINPFDEPNVTESKKNTQQILTHFTTYGKMPQQISGEKNGWKWQYSPNLLKSIKTEHLNDLVSGLKQFFGNIAGGGYFGLLAYLPHKPEVETIARQIRAVVSKGLNCATVFGFGPRYLHSSGQEHKGGPANGAFLIITRDEKEPLDIPGEPFDFGQLQYAQALGDYKSLADKGRQVIHLHVGADYQEDLSQLLSVIKQVLI